MEKNKAELLQSALKQTEALNNVGIPDSVREKMETLNKKIIYLEKSKSENNTITQKNEIQKEIFDARRNLEKFKEYLEKEFPVYFKYKFQTNQQSLTDIRKELTNSQELIEYFQGDSVIYAIAATKEKSLFVKFKHNLELDTLIAAFQKTISINPDFNSLESNYQLFVKYSYKLYNILVRSLIARKGSPSEIKQLIIIPDGLFSLIPFEALLDTFPSRKQSDFKNLSYLIKSYTISYGHSTYMIFNKMENRKPPLFNVLAFSDASAPGDAIVSPQKPLSSLYGTAIELNEVHKYMDGTFYYGKNATESNFKSHSTSYNIIHLALHGGADVTNQGNSKIFFSSGGGDNEDGILYDYELYALQLKANLTILSACETGVGKYYKGEGIYNMGRGFIYAGCPAVVMSYWKINDRITANQIGYFYQCLKGNKTINSALRMAKLKYLSHSDNITAHPVNWASLNAWGKTDMLIEKESKITICLFAGAILIVLMLIFKNRRKLKSLFNFL
jgi:CHAT domain-containing protein